MLKNVLTLLACVSSLATSLGDEEEFDEGFADCSLARLHSIPSPEKCVAVRNPETGDVGFCMWSQDPVAALQGRGWWDEDTAAFRRREGCVCPATASTCTLGKGRGACYWHQASQECISNAERFHSILAEQLERRGKEQFSLNIRFGKALEKEPPKKKTAMQQMLAKMMPGMGGGLGMTMPGMLGAGRLSPMGGKSPMNFGAMASLMGGMKPMGMGQGLGVGQSSMGLGAMARLMSSMKPGLGMTGMKSQSSIGGMASMMGGGNPMNIKAMMNLMGGQKKGMGLGGMSNLMGNMKMPSGNMITKLMSNMKPSSMGMGLGGMNSPMNMNNMMSKLMSSMKKTNSMSMGVGGLSSPMNIKSMMTKLMAGMKSPSPMGTGLTGLNSPGNMKNMMTKLMTSMKSSPVGMGFGAGMKPPMSMASMMGMGSGKPFLPNLAGSGGMSGHSGMAQSMQNLNQPKYSSMPGFGVSSAQGYSPVSSMGGNSVPNSFLSNGYGHSLPPTVSKPHSGGWPASPQSLNPVPASQTAQHNRPTFQPQSQHFHAQPSIASFMSNPLSSSSASNPPQSNEVPSSNPNLGNLMNSMSSLLTP